MLMGIIVRFSGHLGLGGWGWAGGGLSSSPDYCGMAVATTGFMEDILRYWQHILMMMSSNGNIFRITGHLCGEFTGLRWIPHTKASDAELLCFVWSVSK